LSQFTRVTDRQTDGRTGRRTDRQESMQRGKKVKSFPSHMGPWGGADLRFVALS